MKYFEISDGTIFVALESHSPSFAWFSTLGYFLQPNVEDLSELPLKFLLWLCISSHREEKPIVNEAAVPSAKNRPWEVVLAYLAQLTGITFWQICFGWAWVWMGSGGLPSKTST